MRRLPTRKSIRRRSLATALGIAIVACLSNDAAAQQRTAAEETSAAASRAETESEEKKEAKPDLLAGSDAWAPSVLLRSGIVIQTGKGTAESEFASGAPVRPRTTGRQTQIWPMLGGDVEIMSPSLDFVPGAPRIFARGGASYSFAGDKDVAKEGNPMEFQQPIPPLADLVDGKGSRTNVKMRSPIWEAGLGTAFEFIAWDRLLRLRVSGEWMRQKIDLEGETREARDFFGSVLVVEIAGQTSKEFDAVGGGLALELDAMRAGDFMTSVLIEQRVYGWLGSREVEEDAQGPFNSTAQWSYKLDPVAYRTHVGFRIRWQPE